MLSNSDTVWAWERYQDYKIIEVKNRRSINSDGAGRGKVSELIILNY
jgi:site-specific DNA-adenine methylase